MIQPKPATPSPGEAPEFASTLKQSADRLIGWIEAHCYCAYDPGDGNNSYLHALTFNNIMLERLLQQAVYRAPFNLRPILGIRPHTSTKGMGYIAWGCLKLFQATGNPDYSRRAVHCLDWLMKHPSAGFDDYCWGNAFCFSSRGGRLPKGTPTIVWSSLIALAFLEAWETLKDERYLAVARSVARWILTLPKEMTDTGLCLSYVTYMQSSIHNSNMLGASVLARVGKITGDAGALATAREAMRYSCTRQRPDGSWYYGEAKKFHWIDNFHTGYNLDSLRRYIDCTGDAEYREQLQQGFAFFKKNFFEEDGLPNYYHNQRYPIDIQCAAQGIDTLTFFSDLDPDSLPLAKQVASWTLRNMQSRDGHFHYRHLRWAKVRTPMLHWGQGTMLKAIAHLLYTLQQKPFETNSHAESELGAAEAPARPVLPSYVLITAARNEESLIEGTICSVLSQTRLPLKWIIVSDGSTDATDAIVSRYAAGHPWIELLRMPEHGDRQFAAKARCFNMAWERLKSTEFDIVANLDADITFEPGYFEFLLGKFPESPELGVAGTPFVEDSTRSDRHTYAHPFAQLEHVSGACQLFRRACFDAVGGYQLIKGGAIDWVAVTTARMKGWKTRTFAEKVCFHHRKIGTGTDTPLMVRFRYGQKAYAVGGHPLWETARALFQMRQAPWVIGGATFLAGYVWAFITRAERPVSEALMRFHREEQMARLRSALGHLNPFSNPVKHAAEVVTANASHVSINH